MKDYLKQGLRGCLLGVLVLSASPALAQKMFFHEGEWNVGARSGYSVSNRNLDTVPINFHVGYTLFKGKPWIFPEGAFEIATEPFLSPVTRHANHAKRDASIEAGLMLPVVTYYFDLGSRLAPYIEGGLGVLYHDFTGYDLGGGFNFTELAGAGLSYFLDENLAINVGYRFRHSSNASLYDENDGINSHSFLAGFSYFLPQR